MADRILDTDGHPIGTSGFYIDLSDTLAVAEKEAVSQLRPEIVDSRAAIERAKGVLMRMYRISDEQAFKVLVWRSQETNTKLRALAEQLLLELPTLTQPDPAVVSEFDHLLLTLHERTPPE
ncbi:ANTAR domain-containing protein [Nocardia miyunensis]|uniref:ANTAR domain-containing protein n=1 Tax=Nocardia miyunensis TaxID=282684 RepID=UPI00082C9A2F|nr:ANTAR domain-containing protein [Nocardia miyunensis]